MSVYKFSEKKRSIVKDFDANSLTIVGDYAPSSISGFVVYHRFSEKTYYISIMRESAERHCQFLNEDSKTSDFYVSSRTIFV